MPRARPYTIQHTHSRIACAQSGAVGWVKCGGRRTTLRNGCWWRWSRRVWKIDSQICVRWIVLFGRFPFIFRINRFRNTSIKPNHSHSLNHHTLTVAISILFFYSYDFLLCWCVCCSIRHFSSRSRKRIGAHTAYIDSFDFCCVISSTQGAEEGEKQRQEIWYRQSVCVWQRWRVIYLCRMLSEERQFLYACIDYFIYLFNDGIALSFSCFLKQNRYRQILHNLHT